MSDRGVGVATSAERGPDGERFAGVRVLIAHDWLITWAGAERCLEQILELFPNADLVVGVMNPEIRALNSVTQRARETWLSHIPGARAHHRWFVPLEAVAFASLDTRGYDLVISSSHAFAKSVRKTKTAPHVCYCYTPARYLWDLRETHWSAATIPQRVALAAGRGILRSLDRSLARGVDSFVAISSYVAERIRRCYGREAAVVYPPVQAKNGMGERTGRKDFALYLGRLVPYKRVELAIESCRLVGLPLVIAGDGPERKRLESIGHGTAQFLGAVSEQEAARLLSTSRLFLFCANEDFGIAPLEANAHGAPVVGLAAGALRETMVEGVTAEFFREETTEAVAAAIKRALARRWDAQALRQNAARFSPERFRSGFLDVVGAALDGVRR